LGGTSVANFAGSIKRKLLGHKGQREMEIKRGSRGEKKGRREKKNGGEVSRGEGGGCRTTLKALTNSPAKSVVSVVVKSKKGQGAAGKRRGVKK